jgi:integrase
MSARQVADRRHGIKRWIVDFWWPNPDGTRKRIREVSPVQTRRGAEEHERHLRNALQVGQRKQRPPAPTVCDFAPTFLTWAKASNKPSEHRKKTNVLTHHLIPKFGPRRLDEITVGMVRDYEAQLLNEGRKPKTVNNITQVLRRLLMEAKERDIIEDVPSIKPLKVGDTSFRWLTVDECRKVLDHAGPWRVPILFAMRTGLRIGELRGLRWCDVDFAAAQITVRQSVYEETSEKQVFLTPKNHLFRTVPLSPEVVSALREYPTRFRNGLVFCDAEGNLRTVRQWDHPLRMIARWAGIEGVSWHVMRHTFASHLAQAGVTMHTICHLMGHSDLRVTMRYAHLAPSSVQHAASALPWLGDGADSRQQIGSGSFQAVAGDGKAK